MVQWQPLDLPPASKTLNLPKPSSKSQLSELQSLPTSSPQESQFPVYSIDLLFTLTHSAPTASANSATKQPKDTSPFALKKAKSTCFPGIRHRGQCRNRRIGIKVHLKGWPRCRKWGVTNTLLRTNLNSFNNFRGR